MIQAMHKKSGFWPLLQESKIIPLFTFQKPLLTSKFFITFKNTCTQENTKFFEQKVFVNRF
ncbi:MAG: hypothetical protein FD170_3679 [Bacteroidetes bacterium]|nr:MAG: hypothetical protein FD170_3679 [Bacteroidota bacterium]